MGYQSTALLFLGLVSTPLASAQDGIAEGESQRVEQQEGSSTDRTSYRKSIERYSRRLDEFRDEVQQIVDAAEQAEKDELDKGFSVTQDQLTQKANQRRVLAIGRFEGFRKKYPDAEYTPHVLYRLAELYWEKAEEEFLDELEEFNRLEILAEDNPEMEMLESPERDYSLPIGLYKEIIDRFPNYEFVDGALYMLGFCYSEENNRQFDDEKAVAALQRLVVDYPDSPATVDASLRLGDRYFESRPPQIKKAIENFRRVVSAGSDGSQYDDGLYMLAWSHYRLGERETALKYFTMLLDWDRETFLESGEVSDYPKEAIVYMALTFSEIAIDFDGHPLETARNWFGKIGPREWEKDVYQALSEKLEEYSRPRWALETLVDLQKRWPLDAGNPDRQKHVSDLYRYKLPDEGPASAARALADLADTYGEGSPWWEANRSNPDALASARKHIQESLSLVAQELHIQAQQKEKLEGRTAAVKMAYSEAADRYRNYLESDPFVSDQEENQWYLANTLFSSGRYLEAIAEFESLASKEGHPYRDGARFQTIKSWEKILINAYGKHNIKPADAVRERVVVASNGSERSVYELVEAHMSYMDAADAIRSAQFEDIPENAQYLEYLERERIPFHYTPAQILHEHGRFEESRPRLEEVIDLFPRSEEAAYAANLLVNSYLGEGDLENVRELLVRFSEQDLGGDPEKIANRQTKFREQLETTVYNLALRLEKEGKLFPSANAFLAFTKEFPESELVDEALYSAGVNYYKAGKITRANELYEDFINRYPDHKDAEGLTFDIAKGSADVLDFEKALDYYGRILKYFGDGEYADGALLNSAQLKVGLGDHKGAATALEDYARRFPEDEDLEGYLWLAGQQWELQGDKEALRFYGRYLNQRRGVHPGHTLEALNWIASYYEEAGSRKAEKAWVDLVETCNTFLAEGKEVRRRGRHLAARVLFKELLKDLEAFEEISYPDESKMSFVTAFNEFALTKKAELDALSDRANQIFQTYSDPVTTMGAFYVVGAAQLAYAELYYNAPTPTMLNDRQVQRFRGAMVTGATPEEEKALGALKNVLKWSETLKESSEWVDKSVVMLNALRPREYPLEKPEIRGVGDSNFVPVAGPRSEPLPKGEEK